MLSIKQLLLVGLIFGLILGFPSMISNARKWLLLAVPIIAIGYAAWWISENPGIKEEQATWALIYIFVPLWPSVGALAGFGISRIARNILGKA